MAGNRFVVGLAAIVLIAAAPAGAANAEVLALHCSGNIGTIWVDLAGSTITRLGQTTQSAVTFPAQISAASINWSESNNGSSVSINRITGTLTVTVTWSTQVITEQCTKSSTPFPATKF